MGVAKWVAKGVVLSRIDLIGVNHALFSTFRDKDQINKYTLNIFQLVVIDPFYLNERIYLIGSSPLEPYEYLLANSIRVHVDE